MTIETYTKARELADLIGEDKTRAAIKAGWRAIRELNSESPQPIVHPGVADYVATAAILAAVEDGLADTTDTEIEQLRAELDRVRADLAAAHNHAHRQDTNLQQIVRAKDELAAERDALKGENYRLRAKLADLGKPADADHWANLDGTCWSDCPACETERAGATR